MNPWKLVQAYELKRLLELQSKYAAAGINLGWLNDKIAELKGKLA